MNGNSNHNGNAHDDYSNGTIKNNKTPINDFAFGNKESMDQHTTNSAKSFSNKNSMSSNGTSKSPNESEEDEFSSVTRRYYISQNTANRLLKEFFFYTTNTSHDIYMHN